MSKTTQKQECLVVYFCTPQEMTKASIMYNVQGDELQMKDQIISEAVSFLKTGQRSKTSWKSIEVNTTKLGKSPGQRLEDVISEDLLLTKLGISMQVMNGPTTEMSITAFEEESPVNVYIKYQSDSFTTSQEIIND